MIYEVSLHTRSKKLSRKSALKVIDFALSGHPDNCHYFVEILGLKTLFAAFMKKGNKKGRSGFHEFADDGRDLFFFLCQTFSLAD